MMRLIGLAAILTLGIEPSLGDGFLMIGREPHPNHLVPMHSAMTERGTLLGDYDKLLVKYLFVTEGELGRMLVRPSFSAEFCLSVDAVHIENSAKENHSAPPTVDPFSDADPASPISEKAGSRPVTSKSNKDEDRYSITVTTAVKSIWVARWEAQESGKPIDVQIERANRPISRNLAVAIQRVWTKALLLTRYPVATDIRQFGNGRDGIRVQFGYTMDGTRYQFFAARGTLEGQTLSPTEGLPLELTRIGLDLVTFARPDAKGKEMTEVQLIDRLRKLECSIPQR
jgi:hypothetical protein